MKNMSVAKEPFKRYKIDDPNCNDIVRIVDPTRRIILENRSAQPGANIIVLLQPENQQPQLRQPSF